MCRIATSQENAAIEKWEKRIKKYPLANNKIELQLTKTFPTDKEAKNNQSHMSKEELHLWVILPVIRTYKSKTYLLHPWP